MKSLRPNTQSRMSDRPRRVTFSDLKNVSDDPTLNTDKVDQILVGDPEEAPSLAKERNDFFSPDLFPLLREFEDKHFWIRYRNKLIGWALETYFCDVGSFLEIGCGNGAVLSYLERQYPSIFFVGADLLAEGLSFARSRISSSQLIQMDALSPPFKGDFSVLGMFDVVEHLDDDELALRSLFGCIKPGGGTIITVPQHPFLWSEFDDYSYHKRRYTKSDLRDKLVAAGFQIIGISSFVSFLLPALLISKQFRRKRENTTIIDYLRIPKPINKLFGIISDIEGFLIKKSLSLPFGGSLLAVARRPD